MVEKRTRINRSSTQKLNAVPVKRRERGEKEGERERERKDPVHGMRNYMNDKILK